MRRVAAASATPTPTSTTIESPGVSVFTSPSVRPGQLFFYFDPVDLLPEDGRRRWADPDQHQAMIDEAEAAVGRGVKLI